MSDSDPRSGAAPDVHEPGISQLAHAAGNARVMQAARDQYILNLGNILWVTVPVVLTVTGFLLYLAVGRTASASGSPVTAGTAPTASAKQPARQSAPLAVAVSYDQHHVDNGAGPCMNWIFKQPLSAIPPAPSGAVDETWAHRYGGLDEDITNFKLAVQGLTPNAVELTDFRVVDIERGPAVNGTDVISTDGCGPATEAGFAIALGKNPPTVKPEALYGNAPAKAIPFPFVVSSTDIQQFQVTAGFGDQFGTSSLGTCGCIIKWRLALDWSYEGKAGTSIIDDDGRPFQTLFPPNGTESLATHWWDNNGVWSRFG